VKPMPDQPFLSGNYAPWPLEGEIFDCEVEGELPPTLRGTYYRNGPNPQVPPAGRYHWFDGDGMIHAFHFEEGRVRFRNRWVRTERFVREREAGRGLFGGLADLGAGDPSVQGVSMNAANTNVVWHGGRLLALWEAGPPHELDPDTLETRGLYDFDGALGRQAPAGAPHGIMTAHPKIDPVTGELLFFGYSPVPPHLVYHVADREGRLLRSVPVEVPFPSMMHDFIATERYAVFPVFPAVFAGWSIAWEPERGTHVGLVPRDGSGEPVWLQTDPCYVFHPLNAHDEGDRVVAEVARHPVLPLFGADGAGPPVLVRWTLDPVAGTLKEEPLDELPCEFPRLDERFAGLPYRHGYTAGTSDPAAFEREPTFRTVEHYDLGTGRRTSHRFRPGTAPGEPLFVPRAPDAPEGDGFLLVLVYREDERRSDLVVLDAQNVAAEPLATVRLPHRVPFGFHGNWRPAGA